jgi:N-acetyl-S-(2-succino)cysteine monooxygenase
MATRRSSPDAVIGIAWNRAGFADGQGGYMPKTMKLGVLMHTGGQHCAAWRHPDGNAAAGFDLAHCQLLAQTAERGKMDFLFVADVMGVRDGPMDILARSPQLTFVAEPLTLMSALSMVTQNIGFIVTASTTYSHPYTVARQMASLDLISQGRAAWNVVTSTQDSEAANYGLEHPLDHAERYARASEFVDVVRGLWGSAEPGLFVGDKQTGILFDAEKIHPFHHHGQFFRVDGILNVPPSAQGRPVIVQAGASGPGRDLAASVAELIFAQSPTIEIGQEYYGDIKARAGACGRDPDRLVVMPGFTPVIAATRAEAEAMIAQLDALLHPDLALTFLSEALGGLDLTQYPLDGPLPSIDQVSNKSKTAVDAITRIARERAMSIRETAIWLASSMTHNRIAGTALEIADMMQYWFENAACDGFLVSPILYPQGLIDFVDQVIPILQDRGLFREDYEGTTLRENLLA